MGLTFWGYYARYYDRLRELEPYRSMLERVGLGLAGRDSILDAGCGTGNLDEVLTRCGSAFILGLDNSEEMLNRAAAKNPDVLYVKADLERPLPVRYAQFDAAVCTNCLYTLQDPERMLADVHGALKSGGLLIVVDPIPAASSVRIFLNHLRGSSGGLTPALARLLHTIIHLPAWLFVGVINAIITGRARTGAYRFRSAADWAAVLASAGYQVHRTELTYAGQANYLEAISIERTRLN